MSEDDNVWDYDALFREVKREIQEEGDAMEEREDKEDVLR